MTDNDQLMEAMFTVARVIQPSIVAIGKGDCGDLAKGPHERAIQESGVGRLLMLDDGIRTFTPRLDILCVDLPREDLPMLVYCLKQNGYLWTKGRLLDSPVVKQHSEYGDFRLYVKQTYND